VGGDEETLQLVSAAIDAVMATRFRRWRQSEQGFNAVAATGDLPSNHSICSASGDITLSIATFLVAESFDLSPFDRPHATRYRPLVELDKLHRLADSVDWLLV